jgi:hypothetical protein
VPRWPKFGRALECADMEMRFRRQWPAQAFAGQRRAAQGAKAATRSSRRRIELRNLTSCHRISRVFECDKNRSRGAAVLAATLTMAPIHSFRLTSRNKTNRTAQATTFELVGCGTHNLILSSWSARRLTQHPPRPPDRRSVRRAEATRRFRRHLQRSMAAEARQSIKPRARKVRGCWGELSSGGCFRPRPANCPCEIHWQPCGV